MYGFLKNQSTKNQLKVRAPEQCGLYSDKLECP